MTNIESSQLDEVIVQLRSLNFSGDVIMDAIDDTNQLVTRSLLINSQAEGERVDNGGQLLAVVTSMRRMISDISRSNKELLEFFTSNDMQQEENRRDLLAALRARNAPPDTERRRPSPRAGDGDGGLGGILAFAAALVGGTIVGFVTETAAMFASLIRDTAIYEKISLGVAKIGNILKGFGQYISSIAKTTSTFLADTKIGTVIIKGFNSIRNALSSLFNAVKLIGESAVAFVRESAIVRPITNTISQITEAWRGFTGALRAVGDTIRPLFGAAEEGLTIGSRLSRMFPNLANFFVYLGDVFASLTRGFKTGLSIGKNIARALPKVFGIIKALAKPLVWITAIYETVMGAIEGYKEAGVMGAIKGAIGGLLIGLVGGIADLAKDIVSWVANLLGFENFSKLLDSFSFSQLIKDGVDAIFDTVEYAFDWFKAIFSFEKFSAAFENFGIAGLWSTLASGILDTLKGAVSWIATMFGAFDLSIALDNFSFTDSINNGLEMVFALPAKIWNWITSMFSWDNLGKLFEDFSLSGLFTDFYGTVLDTLKGTVSWMASLLGFDGISKYLDSFSFTDIFKSAFDAVDEAINSIIDWIMNIPALISELAGRMGETISSAVSGVSNLSEAFAKSVLKDVLPDPAASTSMLNPMHWVAKAIPDSIYEFAGLKAGGKEIAAATSNNTTSGSGQLTDGDKASKAKEAGYNSWDDYESSGWKYKTPILTPQTNTTGAELMNSSNNISVSPVIVNNYGGNTTNTTQSSVNNSNSSYDPIMTGSAMGFTSI